MANCFTSIKRLVVGLLVLAFSGCQSMVQSPSGPQVGIPVDSQLALPDGRAPSEMEKTALPTYVIEPPDILLIDAIKIVPKPPYRLQSLDVLQILVTGTSADAEIAGTYSIDPSGDVELGPHW